MISLLGLFLLLKSIVTGIVCGFLSWCAGYWQAEVCALTLLLAAFLKAFITLSSLGVESLVSLKYRIELSPNKDSLTSYFLSLLLYFFLLP